MAVGERKLMETRELSILLSRTLPNDVSIFGKPTERPEQAVEPMIFTINDGTLNITAQESERDYVHTICERAGLFRQQMEYFPSSHNRPHVLAGHISVKFDNIRDSGCIDWFSGLVKGKSVIPDTNILLNHTLSSHILPIVPFVNQNLRLSRISILELEALAYREDGQYTNKPSIKKRNSIWAFAEVRKLLDGGAELLPPLEPQIIMSFSNIAGTGFADKIIRQEISNHPQSSALILLTNDFINALTAMAENIEVFRISASEPDKISFTLTSDDQLSCVLMEASISYARIKLMNTQTNEMYMTIDGMWPGKTWYDFHRNRTYVTR